jgi:hypothetical protein
MISHYCEKDLMISHYLVTSDLDQRKGLQNSMNPFRVKKFDLGLEVRLG